MRAFVILVESHAPAQRSPISTTERPHGARLGGLLQGENIHDP